MALFLFLFALCVSSAWSIRSAPIYDLNDAEQHFENFIQTHGKQYADENEKQARFEIFKVNLEEVNRANEGQNITIFGPTYFMDLTLDEFHRWHTGYVRDNATDYGTSCSYGSDEELQNVHAPDSFDWRERNAVTPIKDQQTCGSCYAFSTMANIESQYAIKYGQQLDLSEQQIINCDHTNRGCHAGFMVNAFAYLIDVGGAEGENDYPYQNSDNGPCSFDANKVQVRLSGCRQYSPTSQENVKQLLYSNGPLSISIKCDGIRNIQGGLVRDSQCSVGNVNHAVLLVGYGTYNGLPVWIAKNSWGTVWGDQGFFMMERGEDKESCGMMSQGMSSAVL